MVIGITKLKNMFTVAKHKSLIPNLHKIVSDFTVFSNDGENDVIYHGTNKYGTKILGVILFEDDEEEFIRYTHVLLTAKELSDFLSKTITYLEILKQAKTIFLVDVDYNKVELDANIISFDELPKEFIPLKKSYCP